MATVARSGGGMSSELAVGNPGGAPTVVDSVQELRTALQGGASERWIRLRRGDYLLEDPLVLPHGTTLEGEGTMQFDAEGLPSGFDAGSATTIRAAAGFSGDLLALDDEVTLRSLRLLDPARGESEARAGNTVHFANRSPGAYAAATIRDCEIASENRAGIGIDGPTGHAVLVMTRSPGDRQPPEPNTEARVSLAIERSILRASGGGQAIFAINFAPRGVVELEISSNRIAGPLIAAGGVSRPGVVEGARTSVRTRNNSFRFVSGFSAFGWQLFAGSSPHAAGLGSTPTLRNSIDVTSYGDSIEGFRTAILAVAGRRIDDRAGEVSGNRATLSLLNLRLHSIPESGADLVLLAALAGYSPEARSDFPVGESNRLEVTLSGARGSGPRLNEYGHASGFAAKGGTRAANRLELAGSLTEFQESNAGISPLPSAEYFASPNPERP